ncbi:hypothetical protein MSAN_00124800 [Mycena sanguinolenta]|uniref:Uncharacterized protein n=1 Tax=Mycena sanguinolenta TaxID=230812 RepID=A0A8H7DK16_9AGAR|nr:hypothetical protein MSAN_00124800 [Mycena sanguinolenta]
MRAVIEISQKSAIISILNSTEASRHRNIQVGYVTQLAGSVQSLPPASDYLWLDWDPPEGPVLSGLHSLSLGAETIATFIDSITLEQYHRMCWNHLAQERYISPSASTTMNPEAVFHCSELVEGSVEIAFLPSAETPIFYNSTISGGGTAEVMPNSGTRDVFNKTLSFVYISRNSDWDTWLGQANHIFRHLHIISNFEDYVVVNEVAFYLDILQTTADPPEGFLFLCSGEDFRTGPSSYCCPSRVAYWSLDPSGVARLSPEEATQLGFPTLKFTFKANGWYWDSSVYEGLRQFHEAKGFHPYSQDVASHLGHPLYALSSEVEAPFAYVNSDGKDFDADVHSDRNSAYIDDYESKYSPKLACGDSDVDAESFHHPFGGSCGSEQAEISNCPNNNASELTVKDSVAEEISVPSRSLKVLMSIQLVSILFLALSWVYDHVSVSFV